MGLTRSTFQEEITARKKLKLFNKIFNSDVFEGFMESKTTKIDFFKAASLSFVNVMSTHISTLLIVSIIFLFSQIIESQIMLHILTHILKKLTTVDKNGAPGPTKTNTLSHMLQTIDLRGQHQDKSNLTVVYIRLSGVTEEMSGTFTCQLSMSIPHTTTGLFTFIRSRTGELSVTPTIEQRLSPVVKLGESLGYARGDAIHILCSISGKPAPHVVWNYIREDSDGEEEVEAVGQGRLEMFPLAVTKDGTETRKVGLHILCCTETKLSCNLHTSDDQIVRTIVQVLEHGDSWRLEVIQENPALEEEESEDTEEDGEEEGDEEEIWSLEVMLGVGVSSGVLLLAIIICICCCCCSCKRRRVRRLRNREINRREIYSINSSERGRVRSLSRRSTKRKAPNPAFQRVTEYQLQEEPLTISP